MTALSAAFNRDHKEYGSILSIPVAESTTIYKGGLVMVVKATGYAVPGADTASGIVIGVALENADNSSGSNGDINVQVKTDGVWAFTLASVAQGDVGKKCYVSDDNTVVLSGQSNDVAVGIVVGVKATNTAWVLLSPGYSAKYAVTSAPDAVTSHELTDNSGGTDPEDQTLDAVTLPATITDNSGGSDPGDDTIAAITEAATITDNSGGTDPEDDTIAVVTNPDLSAWDGSTYPSAANATAVGTAFTATKAAIAQLAAKMNTNSTAIDSASDAVAQLAAKMNVVTAALTQALEHTALFAAEFNLAQDDIVALRATIAAIETEMD